MLVNMNDVLTKAQKDHYAVGLGYLKMREKKVEYIKQAVMKKIMLFGSDGRA